MTKSRGILASRQYWTEKQLRLLRDLYPHKTCEAVAKRVERSMSSCYGKAKELGIKKTPEFLASGKSGRLDGVRGGNTRFKPGHETWNKGTKGLMTGGVETQFKPGQLPHNTAEVGSYRITKDGTLQRKIGNAKGSNSKRWRGVHELVWVEANGPVPAGHICVFKPGMKTADLASITVAKVECVSLAENMRRNTYHRYGKEVAQLVQLRGAITRQINRKEKGKA